MTVLELAVLVYRHRLVGAPSEIGEGGQGRMGEERAVLSAEGRLLACLPFTQDSAQAYLPPAFERRPNLSPTFRLKFPNAPIK